MVEVDSTNVQPPDFGPTWPLYPEVNQICRVYAPAVIGTNAYPAAVQQWQTPLVLRDRELAYVWEPNGIQLGAGYYDCRLVGSFAGLPLYVTHCCPGGAFGSSSSASSSSASLKGATIAACGCPNVPVTLTAKFSNGSGTCTNLNGGILALNYNEGNDTWGGFGTIAGFVVSILFFCSGAPFWTAIINGPTGAANNAAVVQNCTSAGAFLWLSAGGIVMDQTGLCVGSVNLTITS